MHAWTEPTMTVIASIADAELGTGTIFMDFKKKKDS